MIKDLRSNIEDLAREPCVPPYKLARLSGGREVTEGSSPAQCKAKRSAKIRVPLEYNAKVIEESVEGFISRWKAHAAPVELFSKLEGSPLLECRTGGVIFNVLERTGPYEARPGEAWLIVHAMTEEVRLAPARVRHLELLGLSKICAQGPVLERDAEMLVLDAGFPLVVGVFAGVPERVVAADWLEFESTAPLHGFLVPVPAGAEKSG